MPSLCLYARVESSAVSTLVADRVMRQSTSGSIHVAQARPGRSIKSYCVFPGQLISYMASPIPSRQGSFTSPPPASPRRPSGLGLGAGKNAEERRARREQFRSFYGLKGGPEGVAEGETAKTGNPLDIGQVVAVRVVSVADIQTRQRSTHPHITTI